MIPLFKVRNDETATPSIHDTLNSGWTGQGEKVLQFEALLSSFLGTSIAVNSCTSALSLACYDIAKQYDTIVTSPLTCFATTCAILHAGLKIVWADIDPTTLNIVSGDYDAVCTVHFAGRLSRVKCNALIEDCAHAFGASFPNHENSYRCFSFQSVKTLTTGDGGALVPPPDRVDYFRKMRWYGMDRNLPRDQEIDEAGFKYNMNDLTATLGLANWNIALDSLSRQKENSKYLSDQLPDISLSYDETSACWLHPVLVERRDDFVRYLKENGIESSPAHYRNDTKKCVSQFRSYLPGMDYVEKHMTCIPNGWWINKECREYIVDVVKKGW